MTEMPISAGSTTRRQADRPLRDSGAEDTAARSALQCTEVIREERVSCRDCGQVLIIEYAPVGEGESASSAVPYTCPQCKTDGIAQLPLEAGLFTFRRPDDAPVLARRNQK